MIAKTKQTLIRALRFSERYTKTDMVYLFKGGAWMSFGTIVTYGLAFLGVLAFANLLPRETYGTYQYILAIADLCGILVLGGIDTAITRASARGMDGNLYEAVKTKIRWGILGGLLSGAVGAYYLMQGNAVLGFGLLVSAVAIPIWEAPSLYSTYLQGKRRFDLLTLYDIGTQTFAVVVLIPVLFYTDSLLIILTSYFASYGLARTYFFRRAITQVPPNNKKDPEVISYGKHLTIMQGINNIAGSADKILLWQLLGAAPVAIYTFSQAIPLRVVGVMKIVNRLAFPKMAVSEAGALQTTLIRKVWRFVLLGALGALIYIFTAPYIFSWFFPQYIEAIPYTQALSLLIVLQPFSLIQSSLTAQARRKTLYLFNTITPITRLALFAVCIPLFGLWGAIVAILAAKIIESVALIALFFSKEDLQQDVSPALLK